MIRTTYAVLHPMRCDREAFAAVESPALSAAVPPGWLGYDLSNFRRGVTAIRICAECDTNHRARNEATRLECAIVFDRCEKHTAEQINLRLGENP